MRRAAGGLSPRLLSRRRLRDGGVRAGHRQPCSRRDRDVDADVARMRVDARDGHPVDAPAKAAVVAFERETVSELVANVTETFAEIEAQRAAGLVANAV